MKTDERTRRILDAAVQLAEAGGFAAVRLRDVAQTSGVALGTVYKRFRSKEDLLMGVLSHELHDLRTQLADSPVCGPTPLVRVIGFFGFLTEFLCRRPNLARAVVRSAASGEKALSERLASFNAALFELSFSAMQGGPGRAPSPGEAVMLPALIQVWFSALCGWAGNVYDRSGVVEQVAAAARLMTHGVDRMPANTSEPRAPLRVLVRGAGRPSLSRDEVVVELVSAAGPGVVGELLARPELDVLQLDGPIDEVDIGEAPAWTGTGRPRIVVITRATDAALLRRLAGHVDVVLTATGLPAGAGETLTTTLYLALARGASLQDAHDEAREAIAPVAGDAQIALTTRPGADLRALSLR
ncbi:MAG TPA: TetR/AcrR family transcriptional regulator [Nannocystis sp.]